MAGIVVEVGYSVTRFKPGDAVFASTFDIGYLSQVEQGNAPSPTADRIQHIAKLLNANPDPLLAMAGRIPDELAELIHRHPVELPRLIRVVAGWKSEEIASLVSKLENAQRPTQVHNATS